MAFFRDSIARLLMMTQQCRNTLVVSNLEKIKQNCLFTLCSTLFFLTNTGYILDKRSSAFGVSLAIIGLLLGMLSIDELGKVKGLLLLFLICSFIYSFFTLICVRMDEEKVVTFVNGLENFEDGRGDNEILYCFRPIRLGKYTYSSELVIPGIKRFTYSLNDRTKCYREYAVNVSSLRVLMDRVFELKEKIWRLEALNVSDAQVKVNFYKFQLVSLCKMLSETVEKKEFDYRINFSSIKIENSSLVFRVVLSDVKLGNGDCFKVFPKNILNMFDTVYMLVRGEGSYFNHISLQPFPDCVAVPYWYAVHFRKLGFNSNQFKKINVAVSNNFNEVLPPCTLVERLKYIDDKVPLKNKTARQLNYYLRYIAHLYHNVTCPKYLITKERKIRWLKHVNWVVSSPAVAPIIDNFDIKMKEIKVPEYKPTEKLFEITTAEKVDFTPERVIRETKKERKVKKCPLFDFNYEILGWQGSKNRFNVKDVDTGRVMTKTIPPYVRPDFNPRNPYYITSYCIDKTRSPLKDLLESGLAFHCEGNDRYYRLDGKETIEEITTTEEKIIEAQVKFTEVEIEVPVPQKQVSKYKSKKEHNLEWKKVCYKGLKEKIVDFSNKIVTHNRFACLKPNKKLNNKLHFKFPNNYETTQEDRDFCRINFLNYRKQHSVFKTKIEKTITGKELLEAKFNDDIKKKTKEVYPTRMRYFPKRTKLTVDNVVRGLEKGFFTKKEFSAKKCFREVAFSYFKQICFPDVLPVDFKVREGRKPWSYEFDIDYD